jgi:enoyl-CoA hydratase/carnithine racemase
MELNEAMVAKLIEQMAAATAASQAATQTAQQIAQSTNQMISDLAAKMAQSTSTQAAQVLQEETGMGERYQTVGADNHGLLFSNQKRAYDEYQHESLESIRRNRAIVDKIVSDAQQHDNAKQNIANQALQNAVETANMVAKQAVRHSDIAIDRQWNVDEQGYTAEEILGNQTFKEGIRATVVAAVAEALAANSAATKR